MLKNATTFEPSDSPVPCDTAAWFPNGTPSKFKQLPQYVPLWLSIKTLPKGFSFGSSIKSSNVASIAGLKKLQRAASGTY